MKNKTLNDPKQPKMFSFFPASSTTGLLPVSEDEDPINSSPPSTPKRSSSTRVPQLQNPKSQPLHPSQKFKEALQQRRRR